MKRVMIVFAAAWLAAVMLCGLSACGEKERPEPGTTAPAQTDAPETASPAQTQATEVPSADATAADAEETDAQTTASDAPETTVPTTAVPAPNAAGRYYLDSEPGGYSLELNAGNGLPLRIEQFEQAGLPAMRLTGESGCTAEIRVDEPQHEEILKGRRETAIAYGGREISFGSYAGYASPSDGEAVLLLEKAPGSDAWFTLRVRAADAEGLEAALADAAVGAFLSSAVFNVNF